MHYLKSLVPVIVCLLLINSCIKDEVEPSFDEIRRVVKAEDIPQVTTALLDRMGIRSGFGRFSVNSEESQDILDINWEQILQLVDSAGNETYTFKIQDDDGNPFVFYNLVIRFNQFGNAFYPFLIKYEMSDEFIPEYLETGSLINFSGKISKMVISQPVSDNNQNAYNGGVESPRYTLGNPNCSPEDIDMDNGTSGGGGSPTIGSGGGSTTGFTTYEICEYYIQDVYWVSITTEGITNVEYDYSIIREECYEVTVNHTETPANPECEIGVGDIPILDPNGCQIVELDAGFFVNSCENGGDEIVAWLEANADLNYCELLLAAQFPVEAYRMYKNRIIATQFTINVFGFNGRNDCSDAFRHAFFNAINARDTNSAIAEAFGKAHECDTPESEEQERRMDLHNNATGNEIGSRNKNASNPEIANLVLEAMGEGKLKLFQNPSDPSLGFITSEDCL